ncbi:hypothetical protein [Nonomuraea sp. NPDC049695]|uniref:hypothetical protein n=1 Tax=Nonomuraea sp. NPDC049695 TaxID=3154734 RepID=UPI003449397B
MSPGGRAGHWWPGRRSRTQAPTASETPAEAVHIMLGSIALIISAGLLVLSVSAGTPLLTAVIGVVIALIMTDIMRAHRRARHPRERL